MKNIKTTIAICLAASVLIACNSGRESVKMQASIQSTMESIEMKNLNETIEDRAGMAYTIITMRIDDEAQYAEYRRQSGPIFAKVGGHLEREFEIVGEPVGNIADLGKPNRLLVLYYDSHDGDEKLLNDPDYQRVRKIMDASTSHVRIITGTSAHYQSSQSLEQDRMYLMKVSYYKQEKQDDRMADLKAVGALLQSYNFFTERMVTVDEAFGIAIPNEVTIHFHDDPEDYEQLHQDEGVMGAIQAYNEKYLDKFAYLGLRLL